MLTNAITKAKRAAKVLSKITYGLDSWVLRHCRGRDETVPIRTRSSWFPISRLKGLIIQVSSMRPCGRVLISYPVVMMPFHAGICAFTLDRVGLSEHSRCGRRLWPNLSRWRRTELVVWFTCTIRAPYCSLGIWLKYLVRYRLKSQVPRCYHYCSR